MNLAISRGACTPKKKRCPEYFIWVHSIRSHRYLNDMPFFPIRSSFRQFTVLQRFLKLAGKNFEYLKSPLVPIIVLKSTVLIPRFEKWTILCRDIYKKILNMKCKTKPQPHFVFLKYLGPGWTVFKTDYALKPWHWDIHLEYSKRSKESF